MRHPRSNLSAAVRAALLAVLAMLVARGEALAQNKPSVAVLGLEVIDDGTGIDPQTTDLAKLLTQSLRDRTRLQNSPYRLAPNSDKELLELKRVVLREDKIEINQAVQFEFDKAVLLDESKGLLDEVAKIIKDHPDIKKVRVEGHTDNVGDPAYNKRLSQQRAQAVRTYLISQGVEAKRLVAEGYGMDKPIDTNDTEEGRAKNRRVEFNIIKRDEAAPVKPE